MSPVSPEERSAASHDAVRAELQRVLASSHFSESERLSSFLKFSVESTLANESGRLKEAVIAVEIFGRETSFNGNSDSIVRNAARRLRAKLESYYQADGRHDPVRIEIPKGGYVPVFRSVLESQQEIELPTPDSAKIAPGRVPRWSLFIALGLIACGFALFVALRHGGPRNQTFPNPELNNPASIRLYSEVVDRLEAFDPISASSLLEKAIAIEPSSPLLHLKLSRAFSNLGYLPKARSEAEIALRLGKRLREEEQLEIAGWFHEVSFEYADAASAYSKLAAGFPGNHDYAVQLADVLSRTGKADAGLAVLDRAARANGGPTADLDLEKARILGAWSDYEQALKVTREAAQLSSRAGLRALYAQARLLERGLLIYLGRVEESDGPRQQAQAVCEQLGDSNYMVRVLRVDGNVAVVRGDLPKARQAYEQGLGIARETHNRFEECNILEGLALLDIREKHLQQAKEKDAGAWRASDGASVTRMAIDSDSAALAFTMADLRPSAEMFNQALSEARSFGSKEGQAEALEGLGDVDALEGRLMDALQSYQSAGALFKEQSLGEGYARMLGKSESMLVSLDRLDTAAHDERRGASEASDRWKLCPEAHLGIADRLLAHDNSDDAAAEARTAIILFDRQRRDVDGEAAGYMILLRALAKAHDNSQSIDARARLEKLFAKTANETIHTRIEIAVAEFALQAKFNPATAAKLTDLAEKAQSRGMRMCSLEAKLALARAAIQDHRAEGPALLARVHEEAKAMGALLIARESQDRPQSQDPHFYSTEKEAALGEQLALQTRRRTTPLGLADVDDYVEKLGRRLAAHMPNAPENWTFSVITDQRGGSTCEPLSLPGGFIFVPARLILAADNEAELAGMLAHAMAHIAEHQAIRQATRAEVAQLASVPLIFVAGTAGFAGDDQYVTMPIAFLKTHRQYELDADRVAVGAIAAAGYDPHALPNYIRRMQAKTMNRPEELSALPPLAMRLSNLEQAIQDWPSRGSYNSVGPFQAIQDQIRSEQPRVSGPAEAHEIPSLLHPRK